MPLVLLSVLLCLLVARRSWRSLPWFFAYVIFAVAAGLARYVTQNQHSPYLWTYWITEAGYALLGICMMYEVFRHIFGDLRRIWWVRLLVPGMFVVSAILTAGRAAHLPPDLHSKAIMLIVLGELFVKLVGVMMFATTVTLVPIVGLQWRQYAFGVAFGFGVYSTVALLATTRLSILGIGYASFWSWALIVAYSCAVLIWLRFFSATEKPVPPGSGTSLLLFEQELKVYRKLLRRN